MVKRETNVNEKEKAEFREYFINLPEEKREYVINEMKDYYTTELVKKYLSTAQEVRENEDKSPEVRRKNLRNLLEPIISLNKLIHQKDNPYRITFHAWEGRNYERDFYPFINEDIIDLETEINLPKLKSNSKKYHIYYRGNIIDMRYDRISFPEYECNIEHNNNEIKARAVNTKIDSKECLLAEYYEQWIQKINSETMQGNADLLDNILFVYAIKRALNGDKKAIEKLYSLYEGRAEVDAIKLAKDNKILVNKLKRDRFYYSDIKDSAKFILWHIISGLRPESLISDLQKEKRDKTLLTPEWAEDFYIWYFSEYLPPLLHEGVDLFERNPEDSTLWETIINLLSPYIAINAMTSWKSKEHKRIFNSDSFRPTKKSNLTVWLFGTKKEPMNGRFMQIMNNFLDRDIAEQKHISEQDFDEGEGKYPGENILYSINKMIDSEDKEMEMAILQYAKEDERYISIFARKTSKQRLSVADQKYFERKTKEIRDRFKIKK